MTVVAVDGISGEDAVMAPRPIITPGEIREAALPRGLRGFDEAATRRLLGQVADTVQTLLSERDRLERAAHDAQARPVADQEDPTAIGNALLAAQRAGEELLHQAREAAERITAEARQEGEQLLEQARQSAAELERRLEERRGELEREHERLRQELDELRTTVEAERRAGIARARAEADELTAHSQQRLEALRREEEGLRASIDDRRRQFVEMLQSALDQVGRRHEMADGPSGPSEGELAEILASRAGDVRNEDGAAGADGSAADAHSLRLAGQDEPGAESEPPASA